jgi:anti-sigma regulatory factor (Ser/Thr protein kinase)
MPLNLKALPLQPDPQSVKEARDWVRQVLTRLHRHDIVDAAELGVSELVTNAILHGTPPISVRVRGTREHPRVEVRDASKRPPEVNVEMAEEDQLLATFGRGLAIVALNASAWGAELVPEGKLVWFEPSDTPRLSGGLTGDVFDLEQTVQQRVADAGLPDNPVRVRLRDLPVPLYNRFRRRYYELGRELRLLSLTHGETYPIAKELADVFLEAEQVHRLTRGLDELDAGLASGAERIDVDLLVPRTAPAVLGRLLETLQRADVFCREQRLLVLAATPEEAALQRWFFGEFVRQAAGDEPRPWPGSPTVTDDDAVPAS